MRVDGLRKAVADENAKVTGGKGSLSGKAPAYDRLVLEKGFADKQLALAMEALNTARGDAQRKQLYLERLAQPSLPDHSMEPRRTRSVLTVFLLAGVLGRRQSDPGWHPRTCRLKLIHRGR